MDIKRKYPCFLLDLYQGASELVRAIGPKKKPARAMLDAEDVRCNGKISSHYVIVENYFGRAFGLWNDSAASTDGPRLATTQCLSYVWR